MGATLLDEPWPRTGGVQRSSKYNSSSKWYIMLLSPTGWGHCRFTSSPTCSCASVLVSIILVLSRGYLLEDRDTFGFLGKGSNLFLRFQKIMGKCPHPKYIGSKLASTFRGYYVGTLVARG